MKPRILQLIGNLNLAGSEIQTAQLARLLHESSRYHVQLACLEPVGGLRDELERISDIPAFPLNSFYDRNAVKQLLSFARFLRERKIDIIHTHDFYTNVFGITGAWLARVPVRIASRRETSGWRTPVQKFVERRAYQLAHAIVANAEAVSNQLIEEGVPEGKIVTVYNGLNFDRVTPKQGRHAAINIFNLPNNGDCRIVTIVANLVHPVKDHPTFLRAARRIRQSVPQARFVIAGEGHLTDEMRALAGELGIEKDVFFIGRCRQVAELLSISDVCVLSSKAEGFSNSILEYMGAGRPVVVTDVGGAREAVIEGETGYLVQPGDYETMAVRIIELLNDPGRAREMGKRGRKVVEAKFSCEAQLTRTEQLYQRLFARAIEPLSRLANVRSHDIVNTFLVNLLIKLAFLVLTA